MEIRRRDSIIIPLMTEENRAVLSLFHYESLLSKVYRRDTRDSSSSVCNSSYLKCLYYSKHYTTRLPKDLCLILVRVTVNSDSDLVNKLENALISKKMMILNYALAGIMANCINYP